MSNPSYPVAFTANSSSPVKLWECDGSSKTLSMPGAIYGGGRLALYLSRDGTNFSPMQGNGAGFDGKSEQVATLSGLNSPNSVYAQLLNSTTTPSVNVYID